MINKNTLQTQADQLLRAWDALQDADERERDGEPDEIEVFFGQFSDMVNTMMDNGVLGDVMEDLSDRMEHGELEMHPDMLLDIIDSLSVYVHGNQQLWQLVAVPVEGPAGLVHKTMHGSDWNQAMARLGIEGGECELVGVARDIEMSLLMLDVVAVGHLSRGLDAQSVHGVFTDGTEKGEFHGIALLRCRTRLTDVDALGDMIVAEQQPGLEAWQEALSADGRIKVMGPRLPREGLALASANRVVSIMERLRATEADQASPGIENLLFGFDSELELEPDDMCWIGALYKDGSAARIQAFPAALVPMAPAVCAVLDMRYDIQARIVELSDMFSSLWASDVQAQEPAGGKLH